MPDARQRLALLAAPAVWTALFLFVPACILVAVSLSTASDSIPPIAPLLVRSAPGAWPRLELHPDTYASLFADPVFALSLLHSAVLAGLTTVLDLALALPMAHAIAGAPRRARGALLAAVLLPFWTSFLIRIFAWIEILRPDGLLVHAFAVLGLARWAPTSLLDTPAAVLIGMVYAYLPFGVLPIVSVLDRVDPSLAEAAADLGAPPALVFLRVTVPLAAPGIAAACLLVFVPSLGEYVIPSLLGGGNLLTIAGELWNEFFPDGDWPTASALAVLLLVIVVAPLLWLDRLRGRVVGERRR